jgi:ABC transporter with metal-binding/Fe-S-binding domain ATP-binding protein
MAKNVAVLFTGGKDSTFAIYKAMNMGMNVKFLVVLAPKNKDSFMFHYPNIELTKLHAEAMGLEIVMKETEGLEEKEVEDLKEVLSSLKSQIDGVVSGALESRYQRVRIDIICRELGLESISPHWYRGTKGYLEEIIFSGFDIIITAVAADGFDPTWLGRSLDIEALKDLEKLHEKHGVHLGGEGGEYETFVVDGPIFKKRIKILQAHKEWDGARGFYIIDKAELVEKS